MLALSPRIIYFLDTSSCLVPSQLPKALNKDPTSIWVFPKLGVPQNGWFIMENPIKTDDLGVPSFLETRILRNRLLHVQYMDLAQGKWSRNLWSLLAVFVRHTLVQNTHTHSHGWI